MVWPGVPLFASGAQRAAGVAGSGPLGEAFFLLLSWRPGPLPVPALFGPQLDLVNPLAIVLECIHFNLGLLGRGDGKPGVGRCVCEAKVLCLGIV